MMSVLFGSPIASFITYSIIFLVIVAGVKVLFDVLIQLYQTEKQVRALMKKEEAEDKSYDAANETQYLEEKYERT